MKAIRKSLIVLLMLTCIVSLMPAQTAFAGVKKYNQKKTALKPYTVKKYKIVKNQKLTPLNITKYHEYDVFEGNNVWFPHLLRTKSCAKYGENMTLQTLFHLPTKWDGLNLGNPQSLVVLPDGNTAYATYVKSGKKGFMVKYDLKKMRELKLNVPGEQMGRLFNYVRYPDRYANYEAELRKCVTVGPVFTMGHGAAFSYNPKDKRIWFVSKTMQKKTDLQRINMKTLKPDLCINYKFDKKAAYGNNITFDKKGRFYFFGNLHKYPKGAIRIYQGSINLKNKKKPVTVKVLMNVIRNSVVGNFTTQAAGFDPVRNRIYMVCDSSLISIPVEKVRKTKLKPSDVWMTQFDVDREFQDFEIDNKGNCYLLTNKRPEIMTKLTNQNKWSALDYNEFDKYGEYQGKLLPDPADDDPINDDPTNNDPTNNDPTNNDPTNNDPINNDPINNDPIDMGQGTGDPISPVPVEVK